MRKVTRLVPMFFTIVLTLAVGVSLAASTSESKPSTNNATTKATAKSKPSASQNRAKPEAKSSAKKTKHVLASADDLSGSITAVDPADKEVTLIGSNGVPYDFKLTKKTEVELSHKKIGVNDLASESHKQATVHFVPRTDGNLAESIQINPS
jgi:hypothetical protein